MNNDTREALLDVADALAFAANRLAGVAEEQDEEAPPEPQESTRWMRAARRELAEHIANAVSRRKGAAVAAPLRVF